MRKAIVAIGAGMLVISGAASAYEDVTPTQAYNLTTSERNVYILDVCTNAEWKWVGHPGADNLGTVRLSTGRS